MACSFRRMHLKAGAFQQPGSLRLLAHLTSCERRLEQLRYGERLAGWRTPVALAAVAHHRRRKRELVAAFSEGGDESQRGDLEERGQPRDLEILYAVWQDRPGLEFFPNVGPETQAC